MDVNAYKFHNLRKKLHKATVLDKFVLSIGKKIVVYPFFQIASLTKVSAIVRLITVKI